MTSIKITPELIQQKLSIFNSDERCNPNSECASILVPLIWKNQEWNLIYTRRTGNVSSHQHEVSFPGGSYEPNDINLENTALRETFEEIGIKNNEIRILGALPASKTISGFTVFPFVAIVNWPVDLTINPDEVDSVFSIPIKWLENPVNYYESEYRSELFGIRKVIHYKEFEGEHLWGYTAWVTLQFLEILK
jgi:8-oxo-dGTP pyrophosphatase MutT (NUDIX family)